MLDARKQPSSNYNKLILVINPHICVLDFRWLSQIYICRQLTWVVCCFFISQFDHLWNQGFFLFGHSYVYFSVWKNSKNYKCLVKIAITLVKQILTRLTTSKLKIGKAIWKPRFTSLLINIIFLWLLEG